MKKNFSFLSVLGLVFVTLKLMGYINWSWWLVTLPFYGPIVLAVCLIGVCTIIQYALKLEGRK